MDKISLDKLQGVPRTLLLPLRGKALETAHKNPIVKDPYSITILDQIDHDFEEHDIPDIGRTHIAVRTFILDVEVEQYLKFHPGCIVVNLGCGFDTRRYRLDCKTDGDRYSRGLPQTLGDTIWYNIDLPEVIELRKNFFIESWWNEEIAADITDIESWIFKIPQGKDVLFIAEGLFMYFDERKVYEILGEIGEQFPGGQILFEAYSPLAKLLRFKPGEVANAFKSFKWFIDYSSDMGGWPLKWLIDYNYLDFFEDHWPWWIRWLSKIQKVNRFAKIVHLEFAKEDAY